MCDSKEYIMKKKAAIGAGIGLGIIACLGVTAYVLGYRKMAKDKE